MPEQYQMTPYPASKYETDIAPAGYRPTISQEPAVLEGELPNLPCINAWRRYFAGGSNRPHWVLIDRFGNPYIVEATGTVGRHSVYGEDFSGAFDSVHDAFWAMEEHTDVYTDPNHGGPALAPYPQPDPLKQRAGS